MPSPEPGPPIRDHFLYWQCRLRQQVVRQEGGRPSPGMRPWVTREDGGEIAPAITVLIIEKEPKESTAQFRHIVRTTHDPRERYTNGLKILAGTHYQYPKSFSDVMTAAFNVDSPTAAALVAERRCVLHFQQYDQSYRTPCRVQELDADDPAWQATYWHNLLFNPAPLASYRILAFCPEWAAAKAFPPPS